MILFLYGTDAYRIKERMDEIICQYKTKHKSGLNFLRTNEKDLDVEALKGFLGSVSMFNEKKLAVIENLFEDKDKKEKFFELLKNSKIEKNENIFILVVHVMGLGNVNKKNQKIKQDFTKDKLMQYLLKTSYKIEELNVLSGVQLGRWASKRFEKHGVAIEPSALEFLLLNLPNDSWLIANEIEKLSLYSSKIKLKDVHNLIPQYFSPEIFVTVDALAQKDKKKALEFLHNHIEHGDDPIYLLTMLVFQMRNIFLLKKSESQKMLSKNGTMGMHPFVFRKTQTMARRFSLEELKNIYGKLFETDVMVKTGRLDPVSALDFFVSQAF